MLSYYYNNMITYGEYGLKFIGIFLYSFDANPDKKTRRMCGFFYLTNSGIVYWNGEALLNYF